MTKERRTISIDEEVDDYLGSDGVNASELINKLVKSHASAGGDKRAMLELREEQLMSEVNGLENRLEGKREELESVRDRLSEFRSDSNEVVREAADELEFHAVTLDPDNPAIQKWAEKADLPPEDFLDRLKDYRSST